MLARVWRNVIWKCIVMKRSIVHATASNGKPRNSLTFATCHVLKYVKERFFVQVSGNIGDFNKY